RPRRPVAPPPPPSPRRAYTTLFRSPVGDGRRCVLRGFLADRADHPAHSLERLEAGGFNGSEYLRGPSGVQRRDGGGRLGLHHDPTDLVGDDVMQLSGELQTLGTPMVLLRSFPPPAQLPPGEPDGDRAG